MVDPQSAWAIIASALKPLPLIRQPLASSAGYILAEVVRADRDLPPADRSAMDGYALRSSDLKKSPRLRSDSCKGRDYAGQACLLKLVGEVAAGSSARPRVMPGCCARILTGANIPPGADSVVMVEYTKAIGRRVEIRAAVKPGANILKRGEDARKNQILLRKGEALDAARIGVCASVGLSRIKAFRRPRITVLCTGAELKAPGDKVQPYQVRNSNGPALCAALSLWGFQAVSYHTLPDKMGQLANALRQALRDYDVIILTGGMSVGKYDIVRQAIERVGAKVRVHGVAMKPGKPFLFATGRGRRSIFGLPGNPLSALTGFYEFVLPALRRLSGLPPLICRPALRLSLAEPLISKGGRVRFILGRLSLDKTRSGLVPVKSQSSADLVSAGNADGAIIVPANVTNLRAGEIVEFRPWRALP